MQAVLCADGQSECPCRPDQTEKKALAMWLVDLNFYSPTKKFTRPQVLSVIKTILKFKI